MNLLIPYVPLIHHADPILEEFSYGDSKTRARKLKTSLKQGDYVFFHTSINSKKYITAYYVVDRILNTSEAASNKNIYLKYKNPHITEYREGKRRKQDDVVVFGDPILSRRLERPLLFDKALAEKLSLGIEFKKGFTESQCIGSATRQWRKLSDKDVDVLLAEVKDNESRGLTVERILSTEEVTEIIEKDIENFIEASNRILGSSLELIGRQIDTPVGRIDLMFEDNSKTVIVVELKLNKIGRDAVNQLRRYMDYVEKQEKREVRGVVVCNGVLPAFEEEFRTLRNIRILKYGWKLQVSEI